MPIAAAAIPLIGAAVGGIGGAMNRRPPSLDPTQSSTLDSLLKQLSPQVGVTPKIDPVQQSLLFDQIAKSGVGGANRITNLLSSRGLGRSGLLAQGLTQNSNQMAAAQTGTNLDLQQQAISQRNTTIQQILGLLGVTNIPGQSGIGGFLSGFAGPFAKALSSIKFGSGGGGSDALDPTGGVYAH